MAGLSFLSRTVYAFVPLAMAHGAIVAGTIANRVFYSGETLADGKYEIAIVVAFLFVLVFAPLTVFAVQVARAKRAGTAAMGRLAQRYARDFETTWMPNGMPVDTATQSMPRPKRPATLPPLGVTALAIAICGRG